MNLLLRMALISLTCLASIGAQAQGTAPSAPAPSDSVPGQKREPPPNAYTDCRGKKAGDEVQHQTPEGVVKATCADSPKGLVARPVRPPQKSATK